MEYLNIPSLTCRSKQALSKQQKAAHSYQCPLLHFSHTAFKPSQPHTKTHTSHTPAPGRSGAWARQHRRGLGQAGVGRAGRPTRSPGPPGPGHCTAVGLAWWQWCWLCLCVCGGGASELCGEGGTSCMWGRARMEKEKEWEQAEVLRSSCGWCKELPDTHVLGESKRLSKG
eukprot:1147821-Pelagomonas_calceolata.AAC.4